MFSRWKCCSTSAKAAAPATKGVLDTSVSAKAAENYEVIDLMPNEIAMVTGFNIHSTTTKTIYNGTIDLPRLRKRVQELLAANPWLAGRYVTREDKTIAMKVPLFRPDVDEYFFTVDVTVDGLDEYTSTKAYPVITKRGIKCLDNDEALFRICVTTGDTDKFALTMSINHGIADGTCRYAIYKLLDWRIPMIAHPYHRTDWQEYYLDFEKIVNGTADLPPTSDMSDVSDPEGDESAPEEEKVWDWKEELDARTGDDEDAPGAPAHHAGGDDGFQFERTVNKGWIAEQKAKFVPEEGVPFVSTNDILTSWFFSATEAPIAVIVANMRERIPELPAHLGGNYILGCIYKPGEYNTPAGVRKKLKDLVEGVPNCQPAVDITCDRGYLISNWLSIQTYVDFPGCEQVQHSMAINPKSGDYRGEGFMFNFFVYFMYDYKGGPIRFSALGDHRGPFDYAAQIEKLCKEAALN